MSIVILFSPRAMRKPHRARQDYNERRSAPALWQIMTVLE
jgi:hypothetical protein